MAELKPEDTSKCFMKKSSTLSALELVAKPEMDAKPELDMRTPTFDSGYDVTKGFVDCKGFFGEYGGFSETNSHTAAILADFTQEYLDTKVCPYPGARCIVPFDV